MNTCLVHGQMYPLGSYCPYCGPPPTFAIEASTTFTPCDHVWIDDSAGSWCSRCGARQPAVRYPAQVIAEVQP